MKVIECENPNEALYKGLAILEDDGFAIPSRYGDTIEYPTPVTTVFKNPLERVLISKVRDCNPFFHLMESLWILHGRRDVKFLCEFNKRMVEFSDDGNVFNSPYGYRMRNGTGDSIIRLDQLEGVISILRNNPQSRQAVITLWDEKDLHKSTKDKACNMVLVFRIRKDQLDMIVYNRSNDVIWGAYGANVVQFSMIMEYVAAHLAVSVGTYTHVSNSYHVYTSGPGGEKYRELKENKDSIIWNDTFNTYCVIKPENRQRTLMEESNIHEIEIDIALLFRQYDHHGLEYAALDTEYQSQYFWDLILPVLQTWVRYKSKDFVFCLEAMNRIVDDAWRLACEDWMHDRIVRKQNKQ